MGRRIDCLLEKAVGDALGVMKEPAPDMPPALLACEAAFMLAMLAALVCGAGFVYAGMIAEAEKAAAAFPSPF